MDNGKTICPKSFDTGHKKSLFLNSELAISILPKASMNEYTNRVLPRIQIHRDQWPTEFEKSGPFQKIWGRCEVHIFETNSLSAFRHC